MTASDTFVDSLSVLSHKADTQDLQYLCRLRLLDWIGCALAGAASHRDRIATMLDAAHEFGGVSPVVGVGRSASPLMAAMSNGILAHSAEFDDGNRFGMVHPGAPVIAAIVAMSIPQRLGDADVLRGILVGYEAAIKLARLVQPNAKDAGWHATGICGSIGAALGLGSALRLDRFEMKAALSAAATASSGLLRVLHGSSDLKPYNAGHAAQVGVSAVLLAKSGYSGPEDVLGGRHGYVHVMSGKEDFPLEALGLDEEPGIKQVYVKPYASCRHAHAPVEAALALRAQSEFSPDDIAAVHVATHRMAVHLHDHIAVNGPQSAKMSVPYCVGAALATGQAGLAAFSAASLRDPDVIRLTQLTTVVEDKTMSDLVPYKRPAQVEITLSSGRRLMHRIDLPKGEPETPLSEPELREKFIDLSGHAGMSTTDSRLLIDSILTGPKSLIDCLSVL